MSWTRAGAVIIPVEHFQALDEHLIALLSSLGDEDWGRPTVCSDWSVKDIASHLLDGTLRRLSSQRDDHSPPDAPSSFESYEALTAYLHQLNADWTRATRRLSPRVLIELLRTTGADLVKLFATLDPYAPALFPVAWAGEAKSANWMDVAREYTEKWHHQQQIIEPVSRPSPITTRTLYHPALDTFMRALPHTYRNIEPCNAASVRVVVRGDAGGTWFLVAHEGEWILCTDFDGSPDATVAVPQEVAWLAFTKKMDQTKKLERFPSITIEGNRSLGEVVLDMVSIMA